MSSSVHFDPQGHQLADEEWARRKFEWLPAPKDREYLLSIQAAPVYEPGRFANYIAPPQRGVKGQPLNAALGRRDVVGEPTRSEEHTSELQSPDHLVCRLLLEKKKTR